MRHEEYLKLKIDYIEYELQKLPKGHVYQRVRGNVTHTVVYISSHPTQKDLKRKRISSSTELGKMLQNQLEKRIKLEAELDRFKSELESPVSTYTFPINRPTEKYSKGKVFWEYIKANADSNTSYSKPDNGPVLGDTIYRSKSEQTLALVLNKLNIEYVYEPKIYINGHEFYPDFAIYIREIDKVIFIEHFGMMGDQKYRDKSTQKIREYLRAGLLEGRDIIFFFESENAGIDASVFEQKITAAIMANI